MKTWFIILFFCFISLISVGTIGLMQDDAAMYALTVKNIVQHNQWLAPKLSASDATSFLDKPPLGLWALSIIPYFFGVNESTIHVTNVVLGWIWVFGLAFWLSKTSKKLSLLSTLIFCSTMGLVVFSRTTKLEILLGIATTLSSISLYYWAKTSKKRWGFSLAFFTAIGFLIKSGLGVIFPFLTGILLLIFYKPFRKTLIDFMLSFYFPLGLLTLFLPIFLVLGMQYTAFQELWPDYMASLLSSSKYNTSYLGLGFHINSIVYWIYSTFPWSATGGLALYITLKTMIYTPFFKKKTRKFRPLTLNKFSTYWIFSIFITHTFFFNQTDLRSFVIAMPHAAILSTLLLKVRSLRKININTQLGLTTLWFLAFIGVFLGLIVVPTENKHIIIKCAGIFFIGLLYLYKYTKSLSFQKLNMCFLVFILSFGILFYYNKELTADSGKQGKWIPLLLSLKNKGDILVIYRPEDRPLRMSSDLSYPDFLAGPANVYISRENQLKQLATLSPAPLIILSDKKSWEKAKLDATVLDEDQTSGFYYIKK